VTGAEALPIGLLALCEDSVTDWLRAITGIDSAAAGGLLGVGLILVLCVILMAVQFWCTRTMGWVALGRGRASEGLTTPTS